MERSTDLTRLLSDAAAGAPDAADAVLPIVYRELRRMAQKYMSGEHAGHTLQTTALVHEAFLRLLKDQTLDWSERARFFAAAAEAMRRILIEHARAKGRIKRGGGGQRQSIEGADLTCNMDFAELLALDEAICRLDKKHLRAGQVVRLRFFAGLGVEETAAVLEVAPRTVKADWKFARAWLYEQLHRNDL